MSLSYFSSESVCAGHPDKICDAISDAIVDAAYTHDPYSRVAVETLVTTNKVILAGEVTTVSHINYIDLTKKVITSLGYTDPDLNFSPQADIAVYIHQQSPEIAQGVNENGAGDQGMMFGYACRQTPNLMPLPIEIAHQLTQAIDASRVNMRLPYLLPDGKAQVTIKYDQGVPQTLEHIVLAVPHQPSISINQLKHDLFYQIVLPVINEYKFNYSISNLIVNGAGPWTTPGPASDTGVTGRKIVVDTYGGYSRVGGGAFSGKDATKVDRSGAYAARYLAKNIVANRLADECEIGLAYYIGAKQPIMISINTFDTAKTKEQTILSFIHKLLNLSVRGIIKGLSLNQPIYQATSAYGHFGRPEFPWEKVIVF